MIIRIASPFFIIYAVDHRIWLFEKQIIIVISTYGFFNAPRCVLTQLYRYFLYITKTIVHYIHPIFTGEKIKYIQYNCL